MLGWGRVGVGVVVVLGWGGVSLLPLKVGLTLDRGGGYLPGLCGWGAGLGLPERVYAEASKALGCPEKSRREWTEENKRKAFSSKTLMRKV